jgi:uncharacterized protein YjbI with pentapeptide repeats
MANPEHLSKVRGGSIAWNEWRRLNPTVRPDLSGADMSMAKAREAAFHYGLLTGGMGGSLRDLSGMDFSGADLTGASLIGQMLTGASFNGADLSGANLSHAHLVESNFQDAKLNGCRVYGISTWNVDLTRADQANLIISTYEEPTITVDNLEMAQFIYLLLSNEKIRNVIDTLTSKTVLVLGRFTPERRSILDAIRDALRRHDYLPVMFDFEKPSSRGYTDTITTLARMARFIIADLTDAAEVRLELAKIVPDLPSVPVQPLILASQTEYLSFGDMRRYPWVLEPFRYMDLAHAIASLPEMVLTPAEARLTEMKE